MQISNPSIPGIYLDPGAIRVDKGYYLVTSSFEFFLGVPVFHSNVALVKKRIGDILMESGSLP